MDKDFFDNLASDSKNILKIHINLDRICSAFMAFKDKPEAWLLLSESFLGFNSLNYKIGWFGHVTWDKNWNFFFNTLKLFGIKFKFYVEDKKIVQVRLRWIKRRSSKTS